MMNDKFSQARGGWSRILDIRCEKCEHHVCFYQKDGPGPLKRIYLDRRIDNKSQSEKLICGNCNQELGVMIIYQRENRPAYRLFQDSVKKKIVAKDTVAW